MVDSITVTGMVISSMPVGDFDKRIVLLTKERGKIAVFAKGARRPKSVLLAGTRQFSFGEFVVYEGRTAYNLMSTNIKNYFDDLSRDVEGACYGFYFLELADYYGRENVDGSETLNLLYQSFRALLKSNLKNTLIRRIFELKIMTKELEADKGSVYFEDPSSVGYLSQTVIEDISHIIISETCRCMVHIKMQWHVKYRQYSFCLFDIINQYRKF